VLRVLADGARLALISFGVRQPTRMRAVPLPASFRRRREGRPELGTAAAAAEHFAGLSLDLSLAGAARSDHLFLMASSREWNLLLTD
jgi:hypothetical protein